MCGGERVKFACEPASKFLFQTPNGVLDYLSVIGLWNKDFGAGSQTDSSATQATTQVANHNAGFTLPCPLASQPYNKIMITFDSNKQVSDR